MDVIHKSPLLLCHNFLELSPLIYHSRDASAWQNTNVYGKLSQWPHLTQSQPLGQHGVPRAAAVQPRPCIPSSRRGPVVSTVHLLQLQLHTPLAILLSHLGRSTLSQVHCETFVGNSVVT